MMETYQVIECNSWDEARKEVAKVMHERDLEVEAWLAEQSKKNPSGATTGLNVPMGAMLNTPGGAISATGGSTGPTGNALKKDGSGRD